MTEATVTDLADLERGRREALDATAWGMPFKIFQPRNLCFWTFIVIVAFGLKHGYDQFAPQTAYFLPAIEFSGAVGLVLTAAWILWFRHLDKFEHQSWSVLVMAFVWGGAAACFAMAIYANTALIDLYGKAFGRPFAQTWGAGLTAPFFEETSKAVGFLLIMGLARHLIVTVADGVIIGAFIGLGFQSLEDFVYAGQGAGGGFGVDQLGQTMSMSVTRAASDVVSHPLFTALFCAGLVYVVGTRVQPRRLGRGLSLIAASLLSHGVWDSVLGLSSGNSLLTFVILLGIATFALVALWWAFEWATEQAAPFAAAVLAPEVAGGVVRQSEVDAIAGRRARRDFLRSRSAGDGKPGKSVKWHRRRVIAAVLDLNAELSRSYGADSPDVMHARDEVTRIRALGV